MGGALWPPRGRLESSEIVPLPDVRRSQSLFPDGMLTALQILGKLLHFLRPQFPHLQNGV